MHSHCPYHQPSHCRGFSILELVLVLLLVLAMTSIFLTSTGSARRPARSMQSATQARGIVQGMISYSKANGGWFPGLRSDGTEDTAPLAATTGTFTTQADGGCDPAYGFTWLLRSPHV